MTDDRTLTEATVESLAAQLGLDPTEADRERIRDEIASGLGGYDTLRTDSVTQSPPGRDLDATVDPGPDRDPHNAFLSLFELDGGDGPLSEMDVALKDNIAVGGVRLTCGSEVFADAVPGGDATVVERLLDAGATLAGKTNMDELAYGPTGETSAFGRTKNPVAPGRVSGGSSAGSAAAVAAGTVDAALGTDTGGSIRIPSSFCSLVGFKPTWGAVPQDGVVELAYTLDHVGPIARDTHTAARVLDTIASTSPADSDADSFAEAAASPPAVDSLVLGVPAELFGDYVTDTVERTVRDRVEALAAAGATVRDVSVPAVERAVDVWNAITNVEFAAFVESTATPLFRRDAIDAGWHRDAVAGVADPSRQFGDVVQRKAIEGKYLVRERDADDYVAARNGCRVLAEQFADALADCDALVAPTMATEPFEAGTWSPHSYSSGGDAPPPLAVNTRPANLAGLPAVTVPAGSADTLPVGIQFVGEANDDATVLAVGAAFERFRDD